VQGENPVNQEKRKKGGTGRVQSHVYLYVCWTLALIKSSIRDEQYQ
jgi:hypothetical protein